MKTLAKFGLSALACLAITACGSSGGGDNSAPANQSAQENLINQTNSPPSNTSPTSTEQPAPSTNGNDAPVSTPVPSANRNEISAPTPVTNDSDNSTGRALVISEQDDNVVVNKKDLTAYSPYSINVDGKEVTIGFPGILSGGWANLKNVSTCCGKYSDVRFGVVASTGPNEKDYIYYNGNVSQNIPTSGKASYVGDVIIAGNDHRAFEEDDYLKGKSTFNVDFDAKSLNGQFSDIQGLQPMQVQANLVGKGFNGSVNSSDLGKATLEGKFYGSNAKELGGLFSNDKSGWGGAFGATKQE